MPEKIVDTPERGKVRHAILEFIKTTVKVVVVVAILRIFIIQPFYVRGSSMEPNYHEGEYLVIEKVKYRFAKPRRGDVVVFQYPLQERPCGPLVGNECINFIKRVIGLPGERVEIRDGKVFIYNDQHPGGFELKENYLPDVWPADGIDSRTVDEDSYYVMGDNRLPQGSSDSRSWGLVHQSLILGRVWVTIYPVDQFAIKGNERYPGLSRVE